ncbi:MAG: dinitrogenase iron-molybdenum cofactor biosynthesis protein [Clostridiales bacterium]|jgi:predicted Fe-Mo cluster-binding NifX family protein|nr:dinitrogenase iron-molybdenum cofactor biosynthesis protein [Clostridiales bacterium]
MPIRTAIATTDGKVINEHFGRAEAFYIVDIDETEAPVVEKRAVTHLCGGGDHDEDVLQKTIERLLDCRVILVAKIGPGARRALEAAGLSVFEIGLPIPEAIEKTRGYYFRHKGGANG